MIKTNKEHIIQQAAIGWIDHSRDGNEFVHKNDGQAYILPGSGSITYNLELGSPAFGWEADHVEPGVSIRHQKEEENLTLITLACVGNIATVVSGDGKGKKGVVIGSHLGENRTILQFDQETLESLVIEDKIQIKTCGQGLKLLEHPEIKVMNIDPHLFERLEIEDAVKDLIVPVTTVIPSTLMGSGIGLGTAYKGDYDIMTQDKRAVKKYGIDKLKIGDFVLLSDCDNTLGRTYLKGAVSVGVIVHTDCVYPGHGPGVMTILSSKKPLIKAKIDPSANLKKYLQAYL